MTISESRFPNDFHERWFTLKKKKNIEFLLTSIIPKANTFTSSLYNQTFHPIPSRENGLKLIFEWP